MIYVTSDLHGKFECLKKLLKEANFSGRDWLYIIGDVTDRNEQGGVDILLWLLYQTNVQLILGNHEAFITGNRWLLEKVEEETLKKLGGEQMSMLLAWQDNGGEVTMKNLKKLSEENRADILEYLDDCPLYETTEVNGKNYILVHGGLGNYEKNKKLSDYTADDLIWSRPTMTTSYDPENYTAIVGHTPTLLYGNCYKNRMIKSSLGWWNVDTGAALDDGRPMLLCLDNLREYYIEEDGSVTVI